jgi:hypothetical protein
MNEHFYNMRSAKIYAYHYKTWFLINLYGIDMFVILNKFHEK